METMHVEYRVLFSKIKKKKSMKIYIALDTVFDLITALCAYVFQNYLEHSVVVKYISTY